MAGTWLSGASWKKLMKALLLYEIVHVSFFFFRTEIVNAQDSDQDWYLTS